MGLIVLENGKISDLELTDRINKNPRKLDQVSRLNLFQWSGIKGRTVRIHKTEGRFDIIPAKPYGSEPWQNERQGGDLREFGVPRFPIEDAVLASELQGVYQFAAGEGSLDVALSDAEGAFAERIADLQGKVDNTISHLELGALKGIVLDADGQTPLINLFNEMEVTQTVVDFDLDNANSEIADHCEAILDAVGEGLGFGVGRTGVRALCGRTFYRKLKRHPKVVAAFSGINGNAILRDNVGYEEITIGGITFEKFLTDRPARPFIGENDAHFFPTGTSIFRGKWSPADFVDAINQVGRPRYVKTDRKKYDMGYDVLVETCSLAYCTHPGALPKGTV